MIKLLNNSNNIFSLGGYFKYNSLNYKSVVVDGETFSKTEIVQKTTNFDNEEQSFFRGDAQFYEIEIKPFDLVYKFVEYKNFEPTIYSKTCDYSLSENNNVMFHQLLMHHKLLDKRILNLWTGKREVSYRTIVDALFLQNSNEIPITLFGYGFNNEVSIDISISDFIEIKNKEEKILNANYLYRRIFKEYLFIDIFEISDLDFAKTLLDYKINKLKRKRKIYIN